MTQREELLVQAECLVNAKTLRGYLAGKDVRPTTRERIENALKKLKMDQYIRPREEKSA